MELHERIASSSVAAVHSRSDPFADVKNRIHLGVIEDLGRQIFTTDIDQGSMRPMVVEEIRERLAQESGISREDRERLVEELTDDIMGHGPLERLLADDTVSEIMVNAPDEVWIEREGILHKTTVRFTDESQLRRIINKIVAEVGRRIDGGQPMV